VTIASTVTFGEQLDWLSSRDLPDGLPEGATPISMYHAFPIKGNPMSEAWNSAEHVVAFKTVVDFAQMVVDEHEVGDDIRLTIELLLQVVRRVGREHPEIIDIDNAEVHA
jgi:hypothetical protein